MENGKEILKNIKTTIEEINDKSDLFTPNHSKYACSISNNKGVYLFTYQCNSNYIKPTKNGIIASCLLDYRSFESCIVGSEEENIKEFANCFGYEDIEQLLKVYNGCKNAYNQIKKMLSNEEINILYNYFEERGEL